MARDYRSEYDSYHSKPEQKKNRAGRNAARATMEKAGAAKKGDGKDVHHKNGKPTQNAKSNLRMESKSKNRGRK